MWIANVFVETDCDWSGLALVLRSAREVAIVKDSLSRFLGLSERDVHASEEVQQIPVDRVRANPHQPRSVFDDEKLAELSATIRTHGMIQPIVVRKVGEEFELVAGERRWRAAQRLGMDFIPAIVRDLSDAQAASVALIENLQREELTPIEEAAAYQRLIELHHLTQESLAQRLGKGQSTIANKLRLLNLPEEVQRGLRSRAITERHARALLVLPSELQLKVMGEIAAKELNVKQTERRVAELTTEYGRGRRKRRIGVSRDVRLALNTLRKSVLMIEQSGLRVESSERDGDGFIEFVVRVRLHQD